MGSDARGNSTPATSLARRPAVRAEARQSVRASSAAVRQGFTFEFAPTWMLRSFSLAQRREMGNSCASRRADIAGLSPMKRDESGSKILIGRCCAIRRPRRRSADMPA